MSRCFACPRACGCNREDGITGFCACDDRFRIGRISLHPWEEPPISGTRGSGTVFFSGCNMRCVFCQNYLISQRVHGDILSSEALLAWLFRLQEAGAHNINLVTPSHYATQLRPLLKKAKREGLTIPICWNSSAYDSVEALRALEGLIDVYLPDFKYFDDKYALKYSGTPQYRETALAAIDEMVRQQPRHEMADGLLKKGVIVRHLLLPTLYFDSRKVLRLLFERYGEQIGFSLMNQYTPLYRARDFPEINRRIYAAEYEHLLDFALELGIEQAYYQEEDAAGRGCTPDFRQNWQAAGVPLREADKDWESS